MGNQKEDFTSVESLGEFTHSEDEDVDLQLGILKKTKKKVKGKAPPPPSENDEAQDPFSSHESESSNVEDNSSESFGESPPEDLPNEGGAFSTESDQNEGNDHQNQQDFQDNHDPFSSNDDEAIESESQNFSADSQEDPFSSSSTDDEEKPEAESSLSAFSDQQSDSFLYSSSPKEDSLSEFNASLSSENTSANTSASAPTATPSSPSTFSHETQEQFRDLTDFAQNMAYGKVDIGGNPPFSIILKSIKYNDDRDDILRILREHKLVSEQNEEMTKNSLDKGSLLISQISEFSAIYLTHKFRSYDLDILMGPSDEIHPPKTFTNSRGLIDKNALKQNKSLSLNLDEMPIEINSILLSTTPQVEGRQIQRYLGVVAASRILEEEDMMNSPSLDKTSPPIEIEISEGEENLKNYSPSMGQIYENLAHDLRHEALKLKGNAVIGINYQITPMLPSKEKYYKTQYKLTCTGNVVWVT